jgi:hypothetical protein
VTSFTNDLVRVVRAIAYRVVAVPVSRRLYFWLLGLTSLSVASLLPGFLCVKNKCPNLVVCVRGFDKIASVRVSKRAKKSHAGENAPAAVV